MSDAEDFKDLLDRVRRRDKSAEDYFFKRYRTPILRKAAVQLGNSGLQGIVGASDVCQMVFGSLFFRLQMGEYELGTEDSLVNLLMNMAKNKIIDEKRRADARGRGNAPPPVDIVAPGRSPRTIAEWRELANKAQDKLAEMEPQLKELRIDQDVPWNLIAAQLGGTADQFRKRWERARDQVKKELGLE